MGSRSLRALRMGGAAAAGAAHGGALTQAGFFYFHFLCNGEENDNNYSKSSRAWFITVYGTGEKKACARALDR